ncbi:hypothetical protein TRFO_16468 [Tritrichomonas foetus]|uniref:Uncharacterized protein n=1 Tax=Tritrichomonas foetus TaxID=1144522 RepID=A0A1J4KPZ3_9EUKA|nr:hypothetical protein TRFO_16468 [Tritrichomonas foetus]|eukprot:OHT13377.1 hypothetical protein TRFO_16468 [Tritrichomonas foetus]
MRRLCVKKNRYTITNKDQQTPLFQVKPIDNPESNFANYFRGVAKREDMKPELNCKFLAIQMPSGIYIYEWFPRTTKFSIIKSFVLAMNVNNDLNIAKNSDPLKNFDIRFADLFNEKNIFSDDDEIEQVSKLARSAKPWRNDLNILSQNRIFVKVLMIPKKK